jgi:hypothetical protein
VLSELMNGIVGEARIVAIVVLPVLILVAVAIVKYLLSGR